MLGIVAITWGQDFANFIFLALISGVAIVICAFLRDWLVSVFKIKAVLDKLDEVKRKLDEMERKINDLK